MANQEKQPIKHNEDLMRISTYVILFVTTLIFILTEPVPRFSISFYLTILFLAIILLMNIFSNELERILTCEKRAQWLFLITSSIMILLVAWVGKFFNVIFLLFMLAAQTYMMLKFKAATILTTITLVSYIIILRLLGLTWENIINLSFSLLVGFAFVVTLSLVLVRYAEQTERAEQLNTQLLEANEKLIEAGKKEKELAAAEERVRLARDIHDGLGHHLTTLTIQLQAAEKLLNNKPEKALEAVQISRQEAKAALEEVRHSVAVMRRNPLDGKTLVEAISHLQQDFSRTIQANIQFLHDRVPESLDPKISNTLYRCVQEGLTNIQKHAQNATQITIKLKVDEDNNLTLSIHDNGNLGADDRIPSGFGLAGLIERVSQLGGELITERCEPQGFILTIKINLTGETYDPRSLS